LIIGIGAGLSIGCRILAGFALVYCRLGFAPLLLEEVRSQARAKPRIVFAHGSTCCCPGLCSVIS